MLYNVSKNNFFLNEKKSTIFTPDELSNFLYEILNEYFDKKSIILDPCVGKGSLLEKWKENGYKTIGIDINNQGWENTIIYNFLMLNKEELKKSKIKKPNLILINPPFNIEKKTKEGLIEAKKNKGRPLVPEVFLDKIIELFGKDIPIVLFVPYGFRLNLTKSSKRAIKFNEYYPEVKSIISLPKNVYENINFHSEILIFNINSKKLKPHYFHFK